MKKVIIVLAILLFVSFGCSNKKNDNKETAFNETYKTCEMNTALNLLAKNVRFGNEINIEIIIENNSPKEFRFSHTSGLKLWTYKDSNWSEITNDVEYAGSDYINIDANSFTVTTISPLITEKNIVRVVVTGNFFENGMQSNKCFGAFVDFDYPP